MSRAPERAVLSAAALFATLLTAPSASPAPVPVRSDRSAELARRVIDPPGLVQTGVIPAPQVASEPGGGTWRSFTPPARQLATAAFDEAGDRMIVFGGADERVTNETWSFDASTSKWTLLAPGGRIPDPRTRAALAYDPSRRRIWMYGGSGADGMLSGLWSLDLTGAGAWALHQPLGTWPDATASSGLVYDAARDRLLLYGGQLGYMNPGTGASPDTWTIDLAADTLRWSRLTPAGPPPRGRWGAVVAFDSARDRMIVIGGQDRDSVFTDAWELRCSPTPTWSLLDTGGSRPPARPGMLGTLDAAGDRVVTAGGIDPGTSMVNPDAWALDLAGTPTWTRLSVGGTPPAAGLDACSAFDPVRRRLLMHGGTPGLYYGGYVSHDTHALDLAGSPAWSRLAPSTDLPTARFGMATVSDPDGSGFWIFGGLAIRGAGTEFTDELWRADSAPPEHWTQLPAGAGPEGRHEPVGGFDPVSRRLVFFGGWSIDPVTGDYRYYDDTWMLDVDTPGPWTRLPGPESGAPAPPARRAHVGIFDPLRRALVIFGGSGRDSVFDDVWELSFAGIPGWRRLAPTGGGPGKRYLARAIYDSPNDRMIVYGGTIQGQSQGDAWALSLGDSPHWSRLAPAGYGPGPRSYFGATYDDARRRMFVWGGYAIDYDVIFTGDDLWALTLGDNPRWEYVAQAGDRPSAPTGPALAYDAPRDRLLAFGGTEVLGNYSGEFHSFAFDGGSTARAAWLLGSTTDGGAIRLLWGTSPTGTAHAVSIERKVESSPDGILGTLGAPPGDWAHVADVVASAQGIVDWTDASTGPGGVYSYRVSMQGRLGGETSIRVPGMPRLVIEQIAPSPARGPLSIRFRSSGLTPVQLTLYDVRGRRVTSTDLGVVPEGPATMPYDVSSTPAGVYFLRLRQGAATVEHKLVIVR